MNIPSKCPRCGYDRTLNIPSGCPPEVAKAISRIKVCNACVAAMERFQCYSKLWRARRQGVLQMGAGI